jgi:hypothetical protein
MLIYYFDIKISLEVKAFIIVAILIDVHNLRVFQAQYHFVSRAYE